MYTALYRKWRPSKFEDIYGQDQVTTTISNELREGKISHAYLFCGTRGTGKTSSAKLFAKAVNCKKPLGINPCDKCESCISINEGNSIDVFEIDAASNRGIDDIRNLRDGIRFTPTFGKYKVYIIDEVHMLTTEAFNALLKTLEEPPSYVIFILATTEAHKLPATILSRCQRFDFRRISIEKIIERISFICQEEKIKCTDDAFRLIASSADGSMRDALSVLDQCSIASSGNVTSQTVLEVLGMSGGEALIKIGDSILREDTPAAIKQISELSAGGRDINQLIRDLVIHFRNLLMTKVVDKPEDIIDQGAAAIDILKNHAEHHTRENIIRCINILAALENEAKFSSNPKILLEIAVVKMCKVSFDMSHDGLISRLSKLEEAIASGTKSPLPESNGGAGPVKSSSGPVKSDAGVGISKTAKTAESVESAESAELTEGEALRKWSAFVKSLAVEKRMKIVTMLRIGKPVKLIGNIITVSFEKGDGDFAKASMEKGENRSEAEKAASNFFGKEIRFSFISEGDSIKEETPVDIVANAIKFVGKDKVEVVEEE